MRRWPPFGKTEKVFALAVVGSGVLIPAAPGMIYSIKSISVTALGAPASAAFSDVSGVFENVSALAGTTIQHDIPSLELPIGSPLNVFTTAAADITVFYCLVDETVSISKNQARANTYNAWKAQKAARENAIRAPNRFGTQTEG
ncbi:hypothetical protein E4G67_00015 [Candidatus Bathyarchaeota archaeon]|nr:MAG: hypothetical protein E4G67_00015 [Candidatus Bathyarchaeota archaeon]